MFNLHSGELLVDIGIVIMFVSIMSAIICIVIFKYTGQKLKEKLIQEYGIDDIKSSSKTKGE